jgi:hypothetical protein
MILLNQKVPKCPVSAEDIHLVRTKGTPRRGGGVGGECWRIELHQKRVGIVFINLIDQDPVGLHASIQIYLNAKNIGLGIGRVAYGLACKSSQYTVIYAHMRKSNIASRKAANFAGFVDATPSSCKQLILRWCRRDTPEDGDSLV